MAKQTQMPSGNPLPGPRVPYWEIALGHFVEEALHTPFQWGQSDCGMLAGRAIETVTGVDVVSDLRGTYSSAEEAVSIVGEDYSGFVQLCDDRLGPQVPPLRAARGDIVLGQFGEERDEKVHSLMVDYGKHYLVCYNEKGNRLVRKNFVKAIKAWRVG